MMDRTEPPTENLAVTGELLQRAKGGDERALDSLLARYRPRLERWASGRLPGYARSLLDTADLVQETLIKAMEGLDHIEVRGPGIFQAYVRQAILNRIKDELASELGYTPFGIGLTSLSLDQPAGALSHDDATPSAKPA